MERRGYGGEGTNGSVELGVLTFGVVVDVGCYLTKGKEGESAAR